MFALQATKREELFAIFLKLSQDLFGQVMMEHLLGDINKFVNTINKTAMIIDELDFNQPQCVDIGKHVPYHIPEFLDILPLPQEDLSNVSNMLDPTRESVFIKVISGSKASTNSLLL